MKKLAYSIQINKPIEFVFEKIQDKSIYPGWAKAWGEGMQFEGVWREGENIVFFNKSEGGTKVIVERLISNECIKMLHIAMVDGKLAEIEPADETMQKWIGSREEYFFKTVGDNETSFEVVNVTDEVFTEMLEAWPQALQYFKDICEAD